MQVHWYSQSLPIFRRSVITIGTFDGVHAGHLQIIEQLKATAKEVNGETVIITFHPHPRHVVNGQQNNLHLLNTLPEKIELLEKNKIDHLVIVPFTENFAKQTALEYIENFLVAHFAPHTIIIGYDHRFGKNREGNYQLLEAMKDKYGFKIHEIPEKILHNITISSTRIRQALLNGGVCEANEFLGYPYFLEGEVVEGKKLGRTIGYPTANIQLKDEKKLVPANGVYAVRACIRNKKGGFEHMLDGMMNIGVRPTVGGTTCTIEVNLFNFDQQIYGNTLRVYFYYRLRGEVKFEGIEELKVQLAKDKEQSILALQEFI